MSFIVVPRDGCSPFCLLHIPKTAGNALIHCLSKNGNKIIRPKILVGHLTLDETIHRINFLKDTRQQLFGLGRKSLNITSFIAVTRDPYDRAKSMYSYIKETSPKITGMHHEHFLFNQINFSSYVNKLCSRENESVSHAWRDQFSYLSSSRNPDISIQYSAFIDIISHFQEQRILNSKSSNIKVLNQSKSSLIPESSALRNDIYSFERLKDLTTF